MSDARDIDAVARGVCRCALCQGFTRPDNARCVIAPAITAALRAVAAECAGIAERETFAPATDWGKGASATARKITDAIRAAFGVGT